MSLFVGNISTSVDQRRLQKEFDNFGKCYISFRDKYAFVQYDDERDAEEAKYEMHKKYLGGLQITVEWSKKSGRFEQSDKLSFRRNRRYYERSSSRHRKKHKRKHRRSSSSSEESDRKRDRKKSKKHKKSESRKTKKIKKAKKSSKSKKKSKRNKGSESISEYSDNNNESNVQNQQNGNAQVQLQSE